MERELRELLDRMAANLDEIALPHRRNSQREMLAAFSSKKDGTPALSSKDEAAAHAARIEANTEATLRLVRAVEDLVRVLSKEDLRP